MEMRSWCSDAYTDRMLTKTNVPLWLDCWAEEGEGYFTCLISYLKFNFQKHDRQCVMHVSILSTVMCISIETPKIINFSFVPNGKLIILGVPKI